MPRPARSPRVLPRAVLAAAVAAPATAAAHPFDSRFTGHQLEVALEPGTVRVAYVVEVPTEAALRDFARFVEGVEAPGAEEQAAYTQRTLDELTSGLTLRVDGEAASATAVPVEEPSGVGDHRFIVYRLQLEAPLPETARSVQVVNANLPGERALFFDEVWVHDAFVVDASDLVEVADGAVSRDRAGQWRADEDLREVRVAFRPRGPLRTAARGQVRGLLADAEVGPLVGVREALSLPDRHPLVRAAAPSLGACLAVGLLEGGFALLGVLLAPVVFGVAGRKGPGLLGAAGASGVVLALAERDLVAALPPERAAPVLVGLGVVGLTATLIGAGLGRPLGERGRGPAWALAVALAVGALILGG